MKTKTSQRARTRARALKVSAILGGVGAVTAVAVIAAPAGVSSTAASIAPTPATSAAAASSPSAAADGAQCSTRRLKENVDWGLDNWGVGLECWGNESDKTVYVRGVLDVPGAIDTHTAWVKILPHTNLIYPPKQLKSGWAKSPYAEPTTRVEDYKCPPIVIGECSPHNDTGNAILAFASLLTNLF